MNTGLKGKVAFITGAAHGQGRSVALALAREGVHSPIQPFEQRRGEIPLAQTGHDRDNSLAAILRAGCDLGGSAHIGAATDADHQAFLTGQFPSPLECLIVGDSHHFVDK